MKIISYNVNGIRAAFTKNFTRWLADAQPDVLCLQESKAQPEQIDTPAIEALGYQHYWYSAQKKGYSGVGILCKTEPKNIVFGCGIEDYDNEGRIIRVDFEDVSVMSVYVPSASNIERLDFKLKFCEDFLKYLIELKKTIPNLIVCGDFNICHQAIDIHDPIRLVNVSGFLPIEREWMTKFLKTGQFIDGFRHFNTQGDQYSWWSYRAAARERNKGWRLDYTMASQTLESRLKRSLILSEAKHSDHCPVLLEID